jgi:hypothetical protein
VPIHQQQDARVEVSRAIKAAHAEVAVATVVGDIESPDTTQDVSQGAIPVFLNFVVSNDGDRCGSLADALLVLGGAVNLDV